MSASEEFIIQFITWESEWQEKLLDISVLAVEDEYSALIKRDLTALYRVREVYITQLKKALSSGKDISQPVSDVIEKYEDQLLGDQIIIFKPILLEPPYMGAIKTEIVLHFRQYLNHLKRLAQATEGNWKDIQLEYEQLLSELESVKSLPARTKATISPNRTLEIITEINRIANTNFLAPKGMLIKEGAVMMDGAIRKKRIAIFMWEDFIILMQMRRVSKVFRSSAYKKLRGRFKLNDIFVEKFSEPCSFQIKPSPSLNVKTLVFYCESEEERDSWLEAWDCAERLRREKV